MSSARTQAMQAIDDQIALASSDPNFSTTVNDQGELVISSTPQADIIAPPPPEGESRTVTEGESRTGNNQQPANFWAKLGQALKTGGHALRSGNSKPQNWLRNIPAPGGIGVPLISLLVLYLILIPGNGHTRMVWLWLVLIGQAHISTANAHVEQTTPINRPGQTSNVTTFTPATNTTVSANLLLNFPSLSYTDLLAGGSNYE